MHQVSSSTGTASFETKYQDTYLHFLFKGCADYKILMRDYAPWQRWSNEKCYLYISKQFRCNNSPFLYVVGFLSVISYVNFPGVLWLLSEHKKKNSRNKLSSIFVCPLAFGLILILRSDLHQWVLKKDRFKFQGLKRGIKKRFVNWLKLK